MEQNFAAWQKAFAELGITIKPDEFFPLEGRGIYIISEILGGKHGLSKSDMELIIENKIKYYKENLKIEFYEGFHSLLEYLVQKEMPLGVVTGGDRSRIMPILNEYFKDVFAGAVTIGDTKKGKPYPDPFLKGAELIGTVPEDCLVIENAPMGIEAGLKAGMTVIAVTTTVKAEKLNGAHFIVKDFFELKQLIQTMI
jgi:beta-phosphoglucomutase